VSGTDTKEFSFWYDQYSDCNEEEYPTTNSITVENTGTTNMYVNGDLVVPGDTYDVGAAAYAGYDTGSSPGFTGGTTVTISPA
jgi:hypothetical protein